MARSMKDSPSNMPDNIRIACHFGIRWNGYSGRNSFYARMQFFEMLEICSFRLKISININFEELFLNCKSVKIIRV